MNLMETLYITHPSGWLHEMGPYHPECPQRLGAVSDQLLASGLMTCLREMQASPASDEALAAVHDPAYIARLRDITPSEGYVRLDQDTQINPYTFNAARHAAGAGIAAVDAVMGGQDSHVAFCAVRPPGHHAMPDQAMGFCFFNNVAVAARHALDAYGLERIAIIDFDVHHGNGTEAMFAGDARVLMCGFYQQALFPHRGETPQAANMCNVPLPPCSGGDAVRALVEQYWLPRLEAQQPQLLLISAGFDAHREDDMGGMTLTETDFTWLTRVLVEVADKYAQGRIVSMLEGGYELSSLGRSVVAHVRALSKL